MGAERSGTSVVAEIVRRWGAYAGASEKLRKGDEHNLGLKDIDYRGELVFENGRGENPEEWLQMPATFSEH